MNTGEASPVACCDNPDPESVRPCKVCEKPTCKNCRTYVDRKFVCDACRQRLQEEMAAAEKGDASRFATAVIGGATGAIIGGAAWAAIAVITKLEVGYVALGVGLLAGLGTVIGSGGKKGVSLQMVSVVCAVVGLILGKYFTLAYYIKNTVEGGEDVGWIDGRLIRIFAENFTEFVGLFDALWLLLAVGIAWKLPAPTRFAKSASQE